jgi:hypothetical protein
MSPVPITRPSARVRHVTLGSLLALLGLATAAPPGEKSEKDKPPAAPAALGASSGATGHSPSGEAGWPPGHRASGRGRVCRSHPGSEETAGTGPGTSFLSQRLPQPASWCCTHRGKSARNRSRWKWSRNELKN